MMRNGIPRDLFEKEPMDEPGIQITVTNEDADMIRVLLVTAVLVIKRAEELGIRGVVLVDEDGGNVQPSITSKRLRERLREVVDMFDPALAVDV